MRIRAINAVSGIHGKERVQMIQEFQSIQEKLSHAQTVSMPQKPLGNVINISPTQAVRSLDQNNFSEEFLQNNSSSTSILATSRDVNLLAQSDAISQEMIQDLKSSMSQSGDNLEDITLPFQKIGVSSSTVKRLTDVEPLSISSQTEAPQPIQQAMEENYIPASNQSPKPIPTNNEEPILEIPADQMFSPNRINALPTIRQPEDVGFVNDHDEIATLERFDENEVMLDREHEVQQTRILHPEEFIKEERIPRSALHQPIQQEDDTGIPAVDTPEKMMEPDQQNPILELQKSVNSDLILSLASTLL